MTCKSSKMLLLPQKELSEPLISEKCCKMAFTRKKRCACLVFVFVCWWEILWLRFRGFTKAVTTASEVNHRLRAWLSFILLFYQSFDWQGMERTIQVMCLRCTMMCDGWTHTHRGFAPDVVCPGTIYVRTYVRRHHARVAVPTSTENGAMWSHNPPWAPFAW